MGKQMGKSCKYNQCQEESGKATCSSLNGFLKYFFVEATQNAKTREGV